MKTTAYYNEFDPKAAAWLRELIETKQIPQGHVDTRSIVEVTPGDLEGYTQCHFFAGIGGWSLALRRAGWPENRPIWTASLPCQPFSTAGKQLGTDDERHLAPCFLELVRQCNPPAVIGEQVASKLARDDWFPGIRLELEALGYEVGAADLCSPCAGEIGEGRVVRGDQESWERVIIGAPHIRQRLYWVARRMADTDRGRREQCDPGQRIIPITREGSSNDGLGNTESQRRNARGDDNNAAERSEVETRAGGVTDWKRVSFAADCLGGDDEEFGDECSICGLTYAEDCECPGPTHDGYEYEEFDGVLYARWVGDTGSEGPQGHTGNVGDGGEPGRQHQEPTGPTGTASRAYELLPCRDGKTRRTQSGIFPLVNGLPRGVVPSGDPSDPSYANTTAEARAVRLKGYGNSIQIDTAVLFIKSYMEVVEL